MSKLTIVPRVKTDEQVLFVDDDGNVFQGTIHCPFMGGDYAAFVTFHKGCPEEKTIAVKDEDIVSPNDEDVEQKVNAIRMQKLFEKTERLNDEIYDRENQVRSAHTLMAELENGQKLWTKQLCQD